MSGLAVATQIFTVTNNVATNVDNGLRIAAYAFNFATVSQAIDVAGNSFSDDVNGIVIRGGVGFTGGTVSQGLTIADNTLSVNSGYGLFVKANGYQFGFVTQTGSVTSNTITDNRFGRAGAIFHASGHQALGGVQTMAFAGNTISHNENGLEARAAYDGGLQNFTFASNTIASNSLAGIKVDAIAASPTQTLSLLAGSGNHVVGNAGPGVFLYNLHPANQTFNINGNDVSGNNGGGPQTVVIGTGVINP